MRHHMSRAWDSGESSAMSRRVCRFEDKNECRDAERLSGIGQARKTERRSQKE